LTDRLSCPSDKLFALPLTITTLNKRIGVVEMLKCQTNNAISQVKITESNLSKVATFGIDLGTKSACVDKIISFHICDIMPRIVTQVELQWNVMLRFEYSLKMLQF
jgi:hypothetical protein